MLYAEGHTYSSEAGYASEAAAWLASVRLMLFAFVYGCLRLVLDIADIRLRDRNPEAELLLLRHELRVLRRQVKRPQLRPAERAIMAAFHRLVPRQALGGLVQPETILGWHRDLVRKRWATFGKQRGAGRPKLDIKLRELILRMARENSSWGCIRIRGELIKLGCRVSATAIRNLLRRQGLGPACAFEAQLEDVSAGPGLGHRPQ